VNKPNDRKSELLSRIVTLSNGKRVANFSSPHEFVFTDGTVLPKVSDQESEFLKVTFIEKELTKGDVRLSFKLSEQVMEELDLWVEIFIEAHVDVVFCPLPMITAIWDIFREDRYRFSIPYGFKSIEEKVSNLPFRSIRIEDRLKKLVSIDKQSL
jgi:hypothetical protein